jgi:signal transduction histidine kinase
LNFSKKIVVLLVLVAVVPVGVSGILSVLTNEREVTARIAEFQGKSAALAATVIDGFFTSTSKSLRLATQFIPFEQFPPEDLPDALKIPYRQFEQINIVSLLDEDGQPITGVVFEPQPAAEGSLSGHEPISAGEVETFGRSIPLSAALATGASFGPVYLGVRAKTPRIALAVAFPVRQGRWVLAVEVSLAGVMDTLRGIAPDGGGAAYVVDGEGRLVGHSQGGVSDERPSLAKVPLVALGLKEKQPVTDRYLDPAGREVAGAFAPIATMGWGLVVEQPVERAFLAARRIRIYTLLWVGLALLVAVFGGILFARGVSGPVRRLVSGVREVSQGRFDLNLPVDSSDEIGVLSDSFNKMASDLRRSFETIQAQHREILRWNQELQQRVEERTRELGEAQEQILQSQKLAAVAELAAGVAHEVNNPLTVIKGFAELMLSQSTPGEGFHRFLDATLTETRRVERIIGDLLRFSTTRDGTLVKVDLNAAVLSAVALLETQLQNQNILVRRQLGAGPFFLQGEPTELQQLFLHLITNAKNAMPNGGELLLQTSEIEGGALKVVFADTGRGIAKENLPKLFEPFFTTKDDWSGKGLGLSVAYRIVKEHQGKITVQSEVGKGSTFTLLFPGLRGELHLK